MNFTPIDMKIWPRNQTFHYFSKMAPTGYSLTVKLDVTDLFGFCRRKGKKFFPTMLWLITKSMNAQMEFRIAEKDGILGFYDTLTPLYANFHEDDKTISFMWTEFSYDYEDFLGKYSKNSRIFGANHGILGKNEMPPENAYTVSCLPWIDFEHFSVCTYENKPYYFPSLEMGKITEDNGRKLLPLSITCHHATTDGWHVKTFLENLKDETMELVWNM